MTTTFRNNAEGGTDGSSLTVGNTTSGDAFTLVNKPGGGAITWSDDQAAHGTMSYKLVSTAGNACQVGVSGWTTDEIAVRWLVYIPSIPSSMEMFRLYATTTNKATLFLPSTGKLRLNIAGTYVWTAAADFPLNSWQRIEIVAVKATSGSNGTFRVRYAPLDSDTITEEYTAEGTANTGTGQFTQPWIGITADSTTGITQYIDDIAMDAQDTYIGRVDTGPAPADTVAPSDVTSNAGSWAANTGTIVDAVADGSSHTEYISVAEGEIVLRLAPMTGAPGTITVTADAGSDTQTLEVELLQGSTVIASHTYDVTETSDDYTLSTTSTERGNVTDATTLDVRLTAG